MDDFRQLYSFKCFHIQRLSYLAWREIHINNYFGTKRPFHIQMSDFIPINN